MKGKKPNQKTRLNFVDQFAMRNSWFKAGYNPTSKEISKILGVTKATYENRIWGYTNMPIDFMIEIAIRTEMNRDDFVDAFFGRLFYDEDCIDNNGKPHKNGDLNKEEARIVYEELCNRASERKCKNYVYNNSNDKM